MRLLRRLHDLGQHPAHILGVQEKNQRSMRPDAGLAEHALAQRLERGLGGMNVGDFVAHMMLPARRVLLEKARDRGVARQRLDQLDLRAVQRAIGAGGIDETHLHSLFGQVERRVDLRRAHHVTVKDDAVGDRRRRNADMVQTSQFHKALDIHPNVIAIPIATKSNASPATSNAAPRASAKPTGLASRDRPPTNPLSTMPLALQLCAIAHTARATTHAPMVQQTEMGAQSHSITPPQQPGPWSVPTSAYFPSFST